MDEKLQSKLQKLLALTESPNEHEANTAAGFLAKILEAHNLDMADLEQKGAAKPGVREQAHDLGKAAFTWKLNLAQRIAEFYYCEPMVDHYRKTVRFLGRPDNVESLQMLYGWVIDQIRRLSTEERRKHLANGGEHIDPLRFQCGFGEGATQRLTNRLREQREKESSEAGSALVLSVKSEISDYLEETYGIRRDGRPTKRQLEREAEWEKSRIEAEEQEAIMAQLLKDDPDAYYRMRPWDTPEARAERAAAGEAARKKEERNAKRRKGRYSYRPMTDAEERAYDQKLTAHHLGRAAADRINLQPFVGEGKVSRRLGE